MKVSCDQKTSVVNLLNFVREIYDIKRPFNGNIEKAYIAWDDIDSNLPGVSKWTPLSQDPNLLCVVERLSIPAAPLPSAKLSAWYNVKADGVVTFKDQLEHKNTDDSGNEVLTIERFDDDQDRINLRANYLAELAKWTEASDLIRRNNAIFDAFLMYRDEVQSSNLKKEMVLGNFIFDSSNHPERNSIKYPILTSSVTVEVLAGTRLQLAVRLNPEDKTVIHNEIFVAFEKDSLNGQEFDTLKTLLQDHNCNLIDAESYQKIISVNAVRLSTKCRWRDSRAEKRNEDEVYFQIYPMPVFFVQTKATGLKEAVGSIIEKIENTDEIPAHLVEIASPDAVPSVAPEDEDEPSFELKLARTAGEDPDILLAKTANAEQLTIAADIEKNDVLLVQGPPGTGKTHTIANLMGHFLAQGKRVLVTSEKVKALSVLKEKLPEAIQPLCVSRLGDKKDLLLTAEHLQNELSSKTVTQLKKSIAIREQQRQALIEELANLRKQIYALRQKDGATITYNGRGYSFIELAKIIREGEEEFCSIIPGQIAKGLPCPKLDKVREIYATNGRWSSSVEKELNIELPASSELPTPTECSQMFDALSSIREKYSVNEAAVSETIKRDLNGKQIVEFKLKGDVCLEVPYESQGMLRSIDQEQFAILNSQDPIVVRMLVIGADDPKLVEKVAEIVPLINTVEHAIGELRIADVDFKLRATINTKEVEEAAKWFIANKPDGKISSWERMRAKIVKPESIEKEEVLKAALEGSAFPQSAEEFQTILFENAVIKAKQQIVRIWNRFVADEKVLPLDQKNENCINSLLYKGADIQLALHWWTDIFEPLREQLKQARVTSPLLVDPTWFVPPKRISMAKNFLDVLNRILGHEAYIKDCEKFEKWRNAVLDRINSYTGNSSILLNLRDSLIHNGNGYDVAFSQLISVENERSRYSHRAELLNALNVVAPDWARAIYEKRTGFNDTLMPANLSQAWEWKQLDILYQELASLSIDELQKHAARDARLLRACTAELAADKAWLAVKLRLEGSGELSALSRMATFMSRASGTGKNVERNRQAAIALLPDCNRAVPAWIMTLDQAIGSFGNAGQFDIIIVDEASQADITALPILFMSKKIIVVGDDKQVTPENVGTQIDKVNRLADQYLQNYVKSPVLFDMKMSLYGLIKANAFRSRMLVEHFRCVPDVIGFSNLLCYEGKIRPLRDRNDTKLLPAIVPWRVDVKNYDFGDFNLYEANAAIDLINAMIAQPEYKGKTFGLISMRSSKGEIDRLRSLVNEKIDPKEKKEREIICGTSAEFQGDERDVIMMLLCDAPAPGEMLRLLRPEANEDAAMKRYNVAVSRAKDQLWVMHSFDPASQLRHEDIRTRLFTWIKGINSQGDQEQTIRNLADSEFEVEVAQALIGRGYRIEQQHEVGSFRIDIVVQGKNAAVALECDGERFHSSDEAVRNDMERQAILERNGWQFIRLRGGEYFRNPEKAMDRVCHELETKGIFPNVDESCTNSTELLDRIKLTLQTGVRPTQIETVEDSDDVDVLVDEEIEDIPEVLSIELPKSVPIPHVPSKPKVIELPTLEAKEPVVYENIDISKEDDSEVSKETQSLPPDHATEREPQIYDLDLDDFTLDIVKTKEPKEIPRFETSIQMDQKINSGVKTLEMLKKRIEEKRSKVDLKSSPVPMVAYSQKSMLTEADKQRILAEDAQIWSELEALDCILIDKRHNNGSLWVVPPQGKKGEVQHILNSLNKRFGIKSVWCEGGGHATRHTPAWYIKNR